MMSNKKRQAKTKASSVLSTRFQVKWNVVKREAFAFTKQVVVESETLVISLIHRTALQDRHK